MIWDYIWQYENMKLLCYEWSIWQFHTCNVDFVIYFYDSSYINLLYNMHGTNDIMMPLPKDLLMGSPSPTDPSTTPKYVSCHATFHAKILGTTKPSHSSHAMGRAKIPYFVCPTYSPTQFPTLSVCMQPTPMHFDLFLTIQCYTCCRDISVDVLIKTWACNTLNSTVWF
jgi:hypothetical protein